MIRREVPLTQETDYRENEVLPAETLERSFDKLTMQMQQLAEESERSVKVGMFSDTEPDELVEKVEDLWAIKDDMTTVAGISSDISAISADLTDIDIVAANISDVNTVAGDIADVSGVATDLANIDTVAGNISDVNTAASNMGAIQDASTQAANAAASATLAQDWAVKTDGPVEGSDYSAKWYALNTDANGKAGKDLDNVTSTGIGKIRDWNTPTYENPISIATQADYSTVFPYTVPEDGFVLLTLDNTSSYVALKVNGGTQLRAGRSEFMNSITRFKRET